MLNRIARFFSLQPIQLYEGKILEGVVKKEVVKKEIGHSGAEGVL